MPTQFYHVVANIDTEFDSIDECLEEYGVGKGVVAFHPKIPATRIPTENSTIPRFSVCEKLEDCFTAIGIIGRFRRCLAANDCAKSYIERYEEAYPVLVCGFDGTHPVYRPSTEEVPDVERTHELWFLEPTKPTDITLKWLSPYSIIWDGAPYFDKCKEVRFVRTDELPGKVHPWLTGTGNILASGLMDYEWEQSRYRKPWQNDEKSLVFSACDEGMSVEDIQCKLLPHRSKKEIGAMLNRKKEAYRNDSL